MRVHFFKGIVVQIKSLTYTVLAFGLVVGCAQNKTLTQGTQNYDIGGIPPSFLKEDGSNLGVQADALPQDGGDEVSARAPLAMLDSIAWHAEKAQLGKLSAGLISDVDEVTVSAEAMALTDFIHYVFGDLLKANYVIEPSISKGTGEEPVTLSIADAISTRELFNLVGEMFQRRGVSTRYANNTFLIYRAGATDAPLQVEIGIGRNRSDVPETAQRIMQVIPVNFGIKVSLERTLRSLSTAKVTPDFSQSVIFVEGRREEVLRAMELVDLLDTPAMRGRYIGMIELSFLDPDEFAEKVKILLENEGIDASIGGPNDKNLVMVSLRQLDALAVFSTNQFLLDRVSYWARIMDVPSEGPEMRYFTYQPRYARALDLGTSMEELLGLAKSGPESGPEGGSTGNAPRSFRAGGADDMRMVVDEKANMLVFYSTGARYQGLQPLLKKLDLMPKQVMLDIVIAEVSLKDEFKHGVEWALRQSEVTLTTKGAFGAASIGGTGFLLDGASGSMQANLLTTNSLVKVLSNPTLMVRDGVKANVSVGSTISIVGQTTQDPINGDRQTTSAEYRTTGVSIGVTPTISAAGIVVLDINESISNTLPGSIGAGGNPDIFERNVTTQVLARSGQTVMLAGLISENKSIGGSGTPGLSKIPILGNLFKAKSESSDRTELVMLITPKVIAETSGWDPLMDDFRQGLKYLQFSD